MMVILSWRTRQCEREMCQTVKSPIRQRTCTCEADFDQTMDNPIKVIAIHHLNHSMDILLHSITHEVSDEMDKNDKL